METKVYIVSARIGSIMEKPTIYYNKNNACKVAESYVYDYASEIFADETGDCNPSTDKIKNWADYNGYTFTKNYFWNGSDDAVETMVTEVAL